MQPAPPRSRPSWVRSTRPACSPSRSRPRSCGDPVSNSIARRPGAGKPLSIKEIAMTTRAVLMTVAALLASCHDYAPAGGNYQDPPPSHGPLTGGSDGRNQVVPLFPAGTPLEPATVEQTATAIITRFGDRVRDRHARESQFQAHDHFLPLYFQDRTYS